MHGRAERKASPWMWAFPCCCSLSWGTSSLFKEFLVAASSQKPEEERCFWERKIGLTYQQMKERASWGKKFYLLPSSVYSVFIEQVHRQLIGLCGWECTDESEDQLYSLVFQSGAPLLSWWKMIFFVCVCVHIFLLLSESYYYFHSVTPLLERWSWRCHVTRASMRFFHCR